MANGMLGGVLGDVLDKWQAGKLGGAENECELRKVAHFPEPAVRSNKRTSTDEDAAPEETHFAGNEVWAEVLFYEVKESDGEGGEEGGGLVSSRAGYPRLSSHRIQVCPAVN